MNAHTRVVILGGGFAGLATARHLERQVPADGSIQVTLVSRDNYLLFTPMLAEVAAGKLQSSDIAVPLRAFLRRVHVWQGDATGVDLAGRTVTVAATATEAAQQIPYDHLVLAMGAVTSYHGTPGAEQYSLPFKRLAHALRIRDRVIDCFEAASIESDPALRRELLTFVVAGGGFSGVELAASLSDYVRELRGFYPRLAGERLYLVLAHHGARLLEELDESGAAYTLRLLRKRGIAVRLSTAVKSVAVDRVELDPGGVIPTRTVLWTAGVAPNPLCAALPLTKDHHGAVVVDEHLAVQGQQGVWALGDCAHVPDPRGGTYGPLAQNAEQEGPIVAHNILATLKGDKLRTFDYKLRGTFASLGLHGAVGEAFGVHFSGWAAWVLWRAVYLAFLPGADRRARVGLDWMLDFLAPPEVTATHSFGELAPLAEVPAAATPPAAAAPPGAPGGATGG